MFRRKLSSLAQSSCFITRSEYSQNVIAVTFGANTNCQTDNDRWHRVAEKVVKLHRSMVDIANLCQHPMQMYAFNQQPRKDANVEVMQKNCNHFARKLLYTSVYKCERVSYEVEREEKTNCYHK